MKKNLKIIGVVGAVVVIAFIAWIVVSANTQQIDYDSLADCLAEKGVIMAGTDTCPACKNQKALFGESFEKISYVNCNLNAAWCTSSNVQYFPTWFFPDGTNTYGVKDAAFLTEAAGCNLE